MRHEQSPMCVGETSVAAQGAETGLAAPEGAEEQPGSSPSISARAPIRFLVPLAVIVAAGTAVRISYVLTVGRHVKLGLDAIGYELLGSELANGSGYSDPVTLLTHGIERASANFPPGYPLFLAALSKLGITTTRGMELAGACVGAVTVLATGLLGRRIGGRSSVGLVAAGLVAISPALVAAAGSSMSETLSVPLLVLVLLAATWAARSRTILAWLGVGALAGVLALVRSEDLLVGVLLVPAAILAVPGKPWRVQLARVAVALVATAAVVSPWVVRNLTTFHPPVVISTAADKTVAGANCRSTYYGDLLGYWDFTCLGHDHLATKDEARYGQALQSEGRRYAEKHLSRVPLVLGVRVLRAWGFYDPSQETRLDALETRSLGWQHLAWPVSLFMLLVAIPGIVSLRRDRLALVLVAGPAVVDTLVVLLTYGNDRFVLSALPSLSIAAAVSLVGLGNRFARSQAAT
jgi:hypothetical protein